MSETIAIYIVIGIFIHVGMLVNVIKDVKEEREKEKNNTKK